MNKVKVNICGREFSIKTEENASYFTGLAKKVENTVNQMISQSSGVNLQSAALLAALSAYDEAQKANESIDNIRTQIKEYVDEACRAGNERDEAVKESEALKLRVSELENELKIARMKNDIDAQLTFDTSALGSKKNDKGKEAAGKK